MSISKYICSSLMFVALTVGCGELPADETAQLEQKIGGGWVPSNSSIPFAGNFGGLNNPVRGVFHSTTPPMGQAASPTGWWVMSPTSDQAAPVTSITYNGQTVISLATSQGYLQVATASSGGVPFSLTGIFTFYMSVGSPYNGTVRITSGFDQTGFAEYAAEWQPSGTSSWSPFCYTPQNPLYNANMLAVGGAKWLTNGNRVDDTNAISLSCASDSIGGCVEWGYGPWIGVGRGQSAYTLKNTHQACTRMKRADFCGNGTSATTLGDTWTYVDDSTTIQVWDSSSIHTAAPQTGATMEAAWDVNGATCVNPSEFRSSNSTYVQKMNAQLAMCPKRACSSTSSNSLTYSARPCTTLDSFGNCIGN